MIVSLILSIITLIIVMTFDFANLELNLSNLAYFIDLPSLIIVVIPAVVLAIGNFSLETYKKTWSIPFGNPED